MSANFLNTLKAWGESLFTAKKVWINDQICPTGVYSESTSVNEDGGYIEVIAPITGYAMVSVEGSTSGNVRLRIGCNGLNNSTFKLTSGIADQYVPCQKGQTVSYMSSEGTNGTITFMETVASS